MRVPLKPSRRHVLSGASALLVSGCAQGGSGAAGGACSVRLRAELPVTIARGNRIVVPAHINDQPVRLDVDTGSQATIITRAAADRLGLAPDPERVVQIHGVGGIIEQRNALFSSFEVGTIRGREWDYTGNRSLPALPIHWPEVDGQPTDGLLGTDMLSNFDVEFDLPGRAMRVYEVSGCRGAFVPWPAGYATIPVTGTVRRQLRVPVQVNGVAIQAVLESGAGLTTLSLDGAKAAGVDESALVPISGDRTPGVDQNRVRLFRGHFRTLAIGPETARDVNLLVGAYDLKDGNQMLLGADWLRRRRVWASYATWQLFVQPPTAARSTDSGQQHPAG